MSDGIDRISQTHRPSGKPRGYQRWRHLLFVHWRVPVAELRRLVPESLEIDTFEGDAFVGLVPFEMQGVRPAWSPEVFAFNFLETNLRTYVHVAGRDPGVYFFSLEAASRIAVTAARVGWGLPYHYANMAMDVRDAEVDYETTRTSDPAARLKTHYRITEELGASKPETLEFFLFERYLLHTERGGRVWTGQVHHTPYPVHLAELSSFEEGLIQAAGLPEPGRAPELCHYSPGVDVEIFDLAPRRT
ncbi:MAG: DUF2071 domain-containing protein [Polyangiaceae bacterium]